MSTTLETLTERVELLEEVVNRIQLILRNVATITSLNQILLIKQQDLDDLKTDVETLEAQLALVRDEVFK